HLDPSRVNGALQPRLKPAQKQRPPAFPPGAGICLEGSAIYSPAPLTLVLISLNLSFRLVPTEVRAVTRTTAISAAIRPYSMAVAPDSSLRKRVTNFDIGSSPVQRAVGFGGPQACRLL